MREKNVRFRTYMKLKMCPIKFRLLLWLLCSTPVFEGKFESKNGSGKSFWNSENLRSEKMTNVRYQTESQNGHTASQPVVLVRKMSSGTFSEVENGCFFVFLRGNVRKCSQMKLLLISSKLKNRRIKTQNGNGKCRQNFTVLHWNIGSRFWPKKLTEIEAATLQYQPDIFAISEANLHRDELIREVSGYRIILPKIPNDHVFSRLIVLVRDGFEVKFWIIWRMREWRPPGSKLVQSEENQWLSVLYTENLDI